MSATDGTLCGYVELDPVRAGLAETAVEWGWSSAAVHAGILETGEGEAHWTGETWRDVLERGVQEAALLERIREATRTGCRRQNLVS
jgi:hypothetical protein